MKVTIKELRSLIAEAIKECGDAWVEPEEHMEYKPSSDMMDREGKLASLTRSSHMMPPYDTISDLAPEAALMSGTEEMEDKESLMGDEEIPRGVGEKVLLLRLQEKKRKKKWMQAAVKKPGALSKELGIPEEENIPMDVLQKKKAALSKKAEGDKKLSAHERKLLQRINVAITAKKQAAKKKKKPAKKVDESFIRNEIAKIIKEELGK